MQNQSVPAEGQNSETKKDVGRVAQPRIVKILRWVTLNGGLAVLAWYAVNGSEGAGRLLMFSMWPLALLVFIVSINKDVAKKAKERGRAVPGWLSHGFGYALIAFLVWHGWIGTAIAVLINEIAEASVFHDAQGESVG